MIFAKMPVVEMHKDEMTVDDQWYKQLRGLIYGHSKISNPVNLQTL